MLQAKTKTYQIRFAIIVAALIIGAVALVSYNVFNSTDIDARTQSEVQQQIDELERRIAAYEESAAELRGRAASLANEIARLRAEEDALQALIDLSQLRLDNLIAEIEANERRIINNQNALGYVIADRYIEGQTTLIERLASSQSLSSFIDQEAKARSVSDNLTRTVREIHRLQRLLAEQRAEVEQVLAEQTAQQELLVAKRSERQTLLARTQGEEAAFQRLRQSASEDQQRLQEELHRMMQAALQPGITDGNLAGFQFRNYTGEQGCRNYASSHPLSHTFGCQFAHPVPFGSSIVDPWALFNRQCVSYTAYRVWRDGGRISSFQGMGHARQWPETAQALMGAVVNHTPAVGAIAVVRQPPFHQFGHTMYVEAILGDGWIRISQFNWAWTGEYSRMDIRADSVIFIHFQPR